MSKRPRFGAAFCFWLVVFSLASAISSVAAQEEKSFPIYEPELTRLLAISSRLEVLNARLKSELESSKKNSQELQSELESLKSEASSLRSELAALKVQCESSLKDSTALRESLEKAESSLTNLEQSFSEYKSAAEKQIKKLKTERNVALGSGGVLVILCIVFAIL